MRKFKDNENREWIVTVDVASMRRVRDLVSVDLYKLTQDGMKGLGELLDDPIQLVDVLYCLCKTDADKNGVSDEAFGRAMWGDPLEAAANALVEELINFFPARKRANLTKLVAAGKKVSEKVLEEAERRIEAVDVDSEAAKLIAGLTSSPAPSESTPAA